MKNSRLNRNEAFADDGLLAVALRAWLRDFADLTAHSKVYLRGQDGKNHYIYGACLDGAGDLMFRLVEE